MSNEIQSIRLRELTPDECDQVSGGIVLLGVSMAITSLYALKIGITSATAITGIIAILKTKGLYNRGDLKRIARNDYPSGGFGSDIRLKTDIKALGQIKALGLTAYSWAYIGKPGFRYVGVMAQDLLAREDLKDAVFTFERGEYAGFYGVNYDQLGLRFLLESDFDGCPESLIERDLAAA